MYIIVTIMSNKKILAVLFSFLAIFFTTFLSKPVNAATSPGWNNFCFPAVQCNTAGSGCEGAPDAVHKASLKTDPSLLTNLSDQNVNVYVVECVYPVGGGNPLCTTGNPTLDAGIDYNGTTVQIPIVAADSYSKIGFSKGHAPILTTIDHFKEANPPNIGNPVPVSTLAQTLMWMDQSNTYDHIFFGYYLPQPISPTPIPGQGGQQQTVLPIDYSTASKVCKPLTWDPSGRVFDSQSLEPVNGVAVSLTRKQADNSFKLVSPTDINVTGGGSFDNPFITDNDGEFSFFVADGTYKLQPDGPGYTFPSVASLNSNYSKAFYDIYPALTGPEIVEQGGPQHRDLPVDSKSGPTVTPLKIMDLIMQADKLGNVYIDGKVSHPLSVVSVYTTIPNPNNPSLRIRSRLIDTITSDRYGRFSFHEDQSTFDQSTGEAFGEIQITKADFYSDTTTNMIVKQFDPLPAYIEGVAKNNSGQPLANTEVQVVMGYTNKPSYTTTTDSNGNFKVPSDYVPSLPYRLVYTNGNSSTTVSTGKFITDNVDYIKANNTELFSPHYTDPKVNDTIKKTVASASQSSGGKGGLFSGSPSGGNGPTTNGGSGVNNQAKAGIPLSQNTALIALIAFIFTVIVVAIIITIYLIKKNSRELE